LPQTQTTPVVFKLTETESEELMRIVAAGNFDSRSSAIRAALGLLYEKHGMLKQTEIQIERERRVHRPIRSKKALQPIARPIVKPMSKAKKRMSASRARKSAV